jgi:hypothetical protein
MGLSLKLDFLTPEDAIELGTTLAALKHPSVQPDLERNENTIVCVSRLEWQAAVECLQRQEYAALERVSGAARDAALCYISPPERERMEADDMSSCDMSSSFMEQALGGARRRATAIDGCGSYEDRSGRSTSACVFQIPMACAVAYCVHDFELPPSYSQPPNHPVLAQPSGVPNEPKKRPVFSALATNTLRQWYRPSFSCASLARVLQRAPAGVCARSTHVHSWLQDGRAQAAAPSIGRAEAAVGGDAQTGAYQSSNRQLVHQLSEAAS